MQIELCAFSSSFLVLEPISSSTRIELCSNYVEGGTTPSPASFLEARKKLANNIYVMIRPRGGDFFYSMEEFELMKAEISWFKQMGADGFVLGILNADGSVDEERTSILVKLAAPLPVTFHRAFDASADLNNALEAVIKTACTRILSSGGSSNVNEGFSKLLALHKQAKGRIDLMPGGGVTKLNVQQFIDAGFKNIHLSAKKMQQSKMEFKSNISMTSTSKISSFDYIGIDFDKLNHFTNYVHKNQKI